MTQQFKFGDRLCNLIGREFIYLMAEGDTCIVVDILGVIHLLRRGTLVLIPHPDTERLDWLADPTNEIGKVMLPGWCSDEYDSLRDAIDAAMQEQAAEAEEQS